MRQQVRSNSSLLFASADISVPDEGYVLDLLKPASVPLSLFPPPWYEANLERSFFYRVLYKVNVPVQFESFSEIH